MATAMSYNPGDVIFSDCRPLLVYLKRLFKDTHCRYCLRKTDLTMCTCEQVGYCNDICKNLDWRNGHVMECGHLCSLMHCREGNPEQCDRRIFTFRLFCIMEAGSGLDGGPAHGFASMVPQTGPDVLHASSAHDFASMVPHRGDESMEEERRVEAMAMAEHIRDCDNNHPVQVDHLVKYMGIIKKYAFDIRDEPPRMFDIGWGLYLEPADLEHACKPTAVCVNDKLTLSVRAIVPIPVGTKPTIDFVRMAMFRQKSTQVLKHEYDIDCKCETCNSGFKDNPSYLQRYFMELASMPELSINQGTWTFVYDKHFLIMAALRELYHEFDERIGLQYLTTLRLALSTEYSTKQEVEDLATKARKHLKITFGHDHPYTRYFTDVSLPLYTKRFGPLNAEEKIPVARIKVEKV